MSPQTLKGSDMKKATQSALVAIPAYALATGSAFAAAIDVAPVVTDIKAQVDPITLIGGAVLLVIVAVVAFRWVRSALR